MVALKQKFLWAGDMTTLTSMRVLVRLIKKSGSTYQEAGLEAGEEWSPKQVYCMKSFRDIIKLEEELIDI